MLSSFKIMKYDPGSSWPNLRAFEVVLHSLRSLISPWVLTDCGFCCNPLNFAFGGIPLK